MRIIQVSLISAHSPLPGRQFSDLPSYFDEHIEEWNSKEVREGVLCYLCNMGWSVVCVRGSCTTWMYVCVVCVCACVRVCVRACACMCVIMSDWQTSR